jgi:hypothetical protein
MHYDKAQADNDAQVLLHITSTLADRDIVPMIAALVCQLAMRDMCTAKDAQQFLAYLSSLQDEMHERMMRKAEGGAL